MIDYDGFETAMSKQRERSRQASQFTTEYTVAQEAQPPTEFTGHKNLLAEHAPERAKFSRFIVMANSSKH